jgi:hypothetical protein
MQTGHVVLFTIIFIILVTLFGMMNNAFKKDTVEVPEMASKFMFLISCAIAGTLLYFNNGLATYIILCFFIFVFFV